MKRAVVVTAVVVAFAVVAVVLADGIGAVKKDVVVQVPKSQKGQVVGFAIANTTANEDEIQIQLHLQGAEPDTLFTIELHNVFYPKKTDPVWIEEKKPVGYILTNSQGNGSLHAVTYVVDYGGADWVDMKVLALVGDVQDPEIKYSARFCPPKFGLPPKP